MSEIVGDRVVDRVLANSEGSQKAASQIVKGTQRRGAVRNKMVENGDEGAST